MAGSTPASAISRRAPMAVARFFRSSPLGGVCALLLLLLASVAVLADRLAPYNPLTANYGVIRDPPLARHVLGTDHLGRDVLSRIIFGARVTLLVAISSVLLGDTIGFIWGVASGYLGGRADLISQRVLDVLMSLPSLILALLLMAGLGAGLTTVIVAIAVTRVPLSSRVVRSMVLSVKELAYVEAALSFVGVGVPPPTPSWGNMLGGVLAEAFKPPWWMVVFPGVAITVTILAVNLFGDALRDFLDPKLK